MTSKKCKKGCATLIYIEHFLILASTISGCVSISVFVSLVGITIGSTISSVGFKICAITSGIKNISQQWKKRKITW